MNTDEITLFRDGRPEAPPYDPTAKARLRLRLLDEAAAPTRRPSRFARRRFLVAGVLAGALAAGGGVVVVLDDDPSGSPGPGTIALRPVAGPQDVAHNAALMAAGEPTGNTGPLRWAYLKTVFAGTQEGGGPPLSDTPEKTRTQEMWRRTDDKQFALFEQGRLKVVDGSKTIPNGVDRVDYPYLLSLPSQPAALLAQVHKTVEAEYTRRLAEWSKPIPAGLPERTREKYQLMKKNRPVPPTAEQRNARAFELITLYMRDTVLPRRTQAALYGALAEIPGVGYQATATDIARRPGLTLSRVENGYLRREIFIDPKTYAYLGFRVVAIKEHRETGMPPVKRGQIIGWSGVIKADLVSRPGRRT
jgi:hypothetical protein